MSILQDLDPQNAKIPVAGSSRGGNKTVWIVPLLLLLAGVGWLLVAPRQPSFSPFPTGGNNPGLAELPASVSAANGQTPVSSVSAPSANAASPTSAGEGGLVREASPLPDSRGAEKNAELNPGLNLVQTRPAVKKFAANSPAKKPLGKPGTQAHASGMRSAQNPKKAADRDIDIIMAIVK